MKQCGECMEVAPSHDYLCRACRRKLDGDGCEYCGVEEVARYEIKAIPVVFGHGMRFKGLCPKCQEIARDSVPLMAESLCPAEAE